jgi:GH25 family lysozyme M1 (1,4-beta-N-acetylmuramidase)
MNNVRGGARRAVAARAALAVALAGAALGLVSPAAGASAVRSQPPPAPTGISAQIATAVARLATTLHLPHAGVPEVLTHPDADHAGARPAARPMMASATTGAPRGLDVSSYQGNVNWAQVAANGARFAYAKASEGTYYTNAYFGQQYQGSYRQGLIRGAYHFAIPNNSAGAAQADFFASHGGAWSADNHTLPGMVDLEYNPYGPECYGLSPAQMVTWVASFVNEYYADTGRWAVVYTTADWWSTCTANSARFAGRDPLWIANYSASPYPLPAGWATYTLWQYASNGVFPGDQDTFNGSPARLLALANNGPSTPPPPPPPPRPPAPSCPLPVHLGSWTLCL